MLEHPCTKVLSSDPKEYLHLDMGDNSWVCFPHLAPEFKLEVGERLDFEDAVETCRQEDATLGRISSRDEFLAVL